VPLSASASDAASWAGPGAARAPAAGAGSVLVPARKTRSGRRCTGPGWVQVPRRTVPEPSPVLASQAANTAASWRTRLWLRTRINIRICRDEYPSANFYIMASGYASICLLRDGYHSNARIRPYRDFHCDPPGVPVVKDVLPAALPGFFIVLAVKNRYVSMLYFHLPPIRAIRSRLKRINAGQEAFLLAFSLKVVGSCQGVRASATTRTHHERGSVGCP
jgi:hypothetical protein